MFFGFLDDELTKKEYTELTLTHIINVCTINMMEGHELFFLLYVLFIWTYNSKGITLFLWREKKTSPNVKKEIAQKLLILLLKFEKVLV